MIDKKIILYVSLFLFGFASASSAQKTQPQQDVQFFIRLALKNNPSLQAQIWSVKEAKEQIPQAGSFPDPVLSVSFMNLPVNSFSFQQEPMSGKQIALMQKFPFPGKRRLQEAVAQSSFQITHWNRAEAENELVGAVKNTYFSLFAVDQLIRVTDKNLKLLQQFIHIAETRYTVGRGLQQDILKAQVEFSKLRNRQIELRQQRISLQAKLNTLTNRAPEAPILTIQSIPLDSLVGLPQQWEHLAFENNPFLKSREMDIQRSDRLFRLARKNFWPDISLGVAYTQRDRLQTGSPGIDYVSAIVSLKLPVFFKRKQSKKAEETLLHLKKARASFQNSRNRIRLQLHDAWAKARKRQEQLKLLKEGILPQARQALEAALSGYQVGKIDFLTLLNNQQTLFQYESDYYRAQALYEIALTEIEIIVGKPIFSNK